jgi:hypothetical protein
MSRDYFLLLLFAAVLGMERNEFLGLQNETKMKLVHKNYLNTYREEEPEIERRLVLANKEPVECVCNKFFHRNQKNHIMQLIASFLDVEDYTSFYVLNYATAKTLRQYVEFHRLDLSHGIIPQLKSNDEKLLNRVWLYLTRRRQSKELKTKLHTNVVVCNASHYRIFLNLLLVCNRLSGDFQPQLWGKG